MNKRIVLSLALIGALGATAAGVHAQQHGDGGPKMGRMMQVSPEDRAAFFDARLAGIKAGLKLAPDQDKLWPAVESAARDNAKAMMDMHEKMTVAGKPADPIEGLRRGADAATARGEMMRKLADAAQPLYATLTEEQKGRLPKLMHGMGPMGMGGGDGMGRHGGGRGEGRRGDHGDRN